MAKEIMEEWEAEGFESKEEYEDYLVKSAEDPLYGYDNLLTMKELRELLQQEPYKPQGDDTKYPDYLLLDEKTGMYYTDFFRDHRTHMVLGHILAVECMECENLDWERVTGGYSPYVIARFQNLCTHPLQRRDGKLIEEWNDSKYPSEIFVDCFEWEDDRAVWFSNTVPETPYLPTDDPDPAMTLRLQELGLVLKEHTGWASTGRVQWDILTTDYMKIMCAYQLNPEDPYHTKIKVTPWNKYTCLSNFEIINEKRGVEIVRQLIKFFRYEWRRIASFNEFGLDQLTPAQKEDFRYFLFEGMEYYLDEWSEPITKDQPKPVEKPKITPEEIFSMRFQREEIYGRFLHFMETEKTEASNGDWARYALALFNAKIFVHSPKTFKSWLPRFCELFGRSVPYQDPNKLNRTTCQRDIYAYLPEWALR